MSSMSVSLPSQKFSQLTIRDHHRLPLSRQPQARVCRTSRTALVPRAHQPLQAALAGMGRVNKAIMAPFEKTAASRQFTVAMMAFTIFNLRRNPTLPKVLTAAAFFAWPRLLKRLFDEQSMWRAVGLQAFNLLVFRNNPCGTASGILACYAAHQVVPLLPQRVHQAVRTAAFVGGLAGGTRVAAEFKFSL